ncbi:MAG: TIGR03905 family TSCPD domain-containing protein [Lachnospiraceae bacterium]|nr:TIGR03905 family TSCPD domain-containing protein [Lachnospiraceae bacterium]
MAVYMNRGTCSRAVGFEVTDGIVHNVRFDGGCDGNTQGVARLVEGRPVEEVIRLLRGIDCAGRGTSCPDQLARALELHMKEAAQV